MKNRPAPSRGSRPDKSELHRPVHWRSLYRIPREQNITDHIRVALEGTARDSDEYAKLIREVLDRMGL